MSRQNVNIDELSDEEVERYLEGDHSGAGPTQAQREGGAPFGFSLFMVFAGLCGMFASIELLRSEKTLLENPGAALTCDLNPLIGCSTFLTSSQNEVFFGTSNAVFGLAFFAGIFALGAVLASGGRLGKWLWVALDALMVIAAAWIGWFQWTSISVENSLCPYCLIVWTVTIPLIINVWARSAQAGHIPLPDSLRSGLVRGRWFIVACIYAILLTIIVVAFWEKWPLVF